MPAAPDWFEALSLRAVASLARVSVDRLVAHAWRHEPGCPALLRDGAVTSTLRHPDRPAATVHLRPARGGGSAHFEHECTCRQWGVCEHVAALLTDLAASDGLREALVACDDARPHLDALPRLREAVRRAWAAERIATAWVPLEAQAPASAPEYVLALPEADAAGRSLQSRVAGFDGSAALDLRVRLQGQRAWLDASATRGMSFAPDDRRILRLLDARATGKKVFRATGADAALVLHLLRAKPAGAALLGDGEALVFAAEALTLHIVRARLPRAQLAMSLLPDEGIRTLQGASAGRAWDDAPGARAPGADEVVDALEARWRSHDGRVDVSAREAVLYRGAYSFLWAPSLRRVFPVAPELDPDAAWMLQSAPAVELLPEHAEALWRGLRKRLRGRAVALPGASAMGLADRAPAFTLHLEGAALALVARLEARYPDLVAAVTPAAPEDERRDPELEAVALAAVTAAGLAWDAARGCLAASDASAARFWLEGAPTLEARNDPTVAVMVPASLARPAGREVITARLSLSQSGSLLDLALALDAGGRKVDLDRVRAALAKKRRWVRLDARTLAEITDGLADLVDDASEALAPDGDGGARGTLPLHQLGRVERWSLEAELERSATAAAMQSRLRALSVDADASPPEGFAATLRPYQRQGLAWMRFLEGLGAGGILADDMGLGKTVMALALVAGHAGDASLVVCPTSVAGNWAREAARFAPTLPVLSLHGLDGEARARADLRAPGLVITTYALLRRDIEALREVDFACVVLDEAHAIKNVDAATTRAARALRARTRLALTGTPLENRLTELWSVADFCNPGMLGTRRSFEARFEKPLAQAAVAGVTSPKVFEAARASARLRALLRPFVLRRTRDEVLRELPPRQEIELACPLAREHRARYDALAVVLRDEVREFARRDPTARPGVAMFTALLRLRQMACDPRLIEADTELVGSKREVFLATARELVAEGRRALVFSQFTELLGLWGGDLRREGIAYEYLDGATARRDEVVRRFQEGHAPLFLVSLKAGGVGLNLTAADTVILADPWWNPFAEDQAIARAHRLGQSRPVTVYRLVAKGTVEDRVVALEERKRAMADAVLAGAYEGSAALAGLTAADVVALLADVEAE